MKFDAFVARRYLKAKRKQTFIGVISLITLLGITLGVTALNLALSIHNGMRAAFVRSLVGETGQLTLVTNRSEGYGLDEPRLRQLYELLGQIPGIAATALMRQEPCVVFSTNRRMDPAKLIGIDPQSYAAVSDVFKQLVEGTPQALERGAEQLPGVILGADLANNLGVSLGDPVRLAIARLGSPGLTTQNGVRLKEMKVEVVGIFRTGNSQFDASDVYLRLSDLQFLLNTEEVSMVQLRFHSMAELERGKLQLIQSRELPEGMIVVDLRDLNAKLLDALKLEKLATTAVILLFILIVALNMVSALIMLVMEKHRDIGIMRAFGTPRQTILRIFLRQGMTLAIRGTALGTFLGVGLALLLDYTQLIRLDNSVYEVLNYLPFLVDPLEVIWVAGGSLILSLAGCLYPAYQAAALDPVEALKYD